MLATPVGFRFVGRMVMTAGLRGGFCSEIRDTSHRAGRSDLLSTSSEPEAENGSNGQKNETHDEMAITHNCSFRIGVPYACMT